MAQKNLHGAWFLTNKYMSEITLILSGCFGALFQEFLYWYKLRTKLENKKYQMLLRSKAYWLLAISMIILSGIGSWLWFYGTEEKLVRSYMIAGACFPMLLKVATELLLSKVDMDLGVLESNPVKDYFGIE